MFLKSRGGHRKRGELPIKPQGFCVTLTYLKCALRRRKFVFFLLLTAMSLKLFRKKAEKTKIQSHFYYTSQQKSTLLPVRGTKIPHSFHVRLPHSLCTGFSSPSRSFLCSVIATSASDMSRCLQPHPLQIPQRFCHELKHSLHFLLRAAKIEAQEQSLCCFQ